MKKVFTVLLTAIVIVLTFTFYAGAVSFSPAGTGDAVAVSDVARPSGRYLFLPASTDLTKLSLTFPGDAARLKRDGGTVRVSNGKAFDLIKLCGGEAAEYTITVTPAHGNTQTITIIRSENVDTLYINTADPAEHGREWIDQSKSNSAKGSYILTDAQGNVRYSGGLSQIKPRGNSSFTLTQKKSYQIKLDEKADLIGDTKEEASKKWVLLANVWGPSMTNTAATFEAARALGMDYIPHYRFVDLYIDGDYRGAYQLCEKTEIGKARINIDDLDDRIEDANKDTDAYDDPVVGSAETVSGAETQKSGAGVFRYVKGLVEPELPKDASHHAFLLELDLKSRFEEELTGFITPRNQCVVTKNPEYLTYETGLYISRFFAEFEKACYAPDGRNSDTGKYWYDYCDADSLVRVYLFNELGKNVDGFRSSLYFYLPEDSDKLYCGPIWDFDRCYGIGSRMEDREQLSSPEGFYVSGNYLVNGLLKIGTFRDKVKAALDADTGDFYRECAKMTGDGGYVMSIYNDIAQSLFMNSKKWHTADEIVMTVEPSAELNEENSAVFTKNYIEKRLRWLSDVTSTWNGDSYSLPKYGGIPDPMTGDVDLNGRIEAADARLALRYSAKLEALDEKQIKAADADGSGQVLADDARKILRVSAKLDVFSI
ncbi:MAG: CotH kinase family protein [Clostridia bacterium]|nr:CotH kinase family protein [Clostridia bacterium]